MQCPGGRAVPLSQQGSVCGAKDDPERGIALGGRRCCHIYRRWAVAGANRPPVCMRGTHGLVEARRGAMHTRTPTHTLQAASASTHAPSMGRAAGRRRVRPTTPSPGRCAAAARAPRARAGRGCRLWAQGKRAVCAAVPKHSSCSSPPWPRCCRLGKAAAAARSRRALQTPAATSRRKGRGAWSLACVGLGHQGEEVGPRQGRSAHKGGGARSAPH